MLHGSSAFNTHFSPHCEFFIFISLFSLISFISLCLLSSFILLVMFLSFGSLLKLMVLTKRTQWHSWMFLFHKALSGLLLFLFHSSLAYILRFLVMHFYDLGEKVYAYLWTDYHKVLPFLGFTITALPMPLKFLYRLLL